MAKKITRTFTVTEAQCLCVSTNAGETTTLSFILDGEVTDSDKALKELRKKQETGEFKIAAVLALNTIETVREMDVEFFYAHSTPVESK